MITLQLMILMAVTVALAASPACRVAGYDENNKAVKKSKAVVTVIFLLLAVFIGLRLSYNDTGTYRNLFEQLESFPEFWDSFNVSLGAAPGFNLFSAFLKQIGFNTQNYLMLFSLLTNGIYIFFLYKYTENFPLTIFLFFATGAYLFTGAAVKQCAATAIALIAINFAIKKKWVPFVLLVLLAMIFHPYSLVFLAVPLLQFKPWSKGTYFMLAGALAVGFMLPNLMESVLNFTDAIEKNYTENTLSGEGVNIFRMLVCNAPTILTFVYRDKLFENSSRQDNLIMNLTMINGALMIVAMFGSAIHFARLANFFVIFQTLSIPWILRRLPTTSKTFVGIVVVIGYLLYFSYSLFFSGANFNDSFRKMNLLEYVLNYLFAWG